MQVLYNLINHKNVKDADMVTANAKRYTTFKISKCRMDYEKARVFDISGTNMLTRGIPIRLFSKITCDSNGQPRYHCRRNHPRILAEPH